MELLPIKKNPNFKIQEKKTKGGEGYGTRYLMHKNSGKPLHFMMPKSSEDYNDYVKFYKTGALICHDLNGMVCQRGENGKVVKEFGRAYAKTFFDNEGSTLLHTSDAGIESTPGSFSFKDRSIHDWRIEQGGINVTKNSIDGTITDEFHSWEELKEQATEIEQQEQQEQQKLSKLILEEEINKQKKETQDHKSF